jgi:hypothetical protein
MSKLALSLTPVTDMADPNTLQRHVPESLSDRELGQRRGRNPTLLRSTVQRTISTRLTSA